MSSRAGTSRSVFFLTDNRETIAGLQDFFEEQLWEKLPSSWRSVLQTVTPDEFGDWLIGDISR
jgi:hypothetical protein